MRVCTRVSAPRYQMWHMITDWLIMLMTNSEVCHMPFSSSSLILYLNIFGRSDHGKNSHSYSFHRSCQLYRTHAARAGVGRAEDYLKQSPNFTSRLHPLSEAFFTGEANKEATPSNTRARKSEARWHDSTGCSRFNVICFRDPVLSNLCLAHPCAPGGTSNWYEWRGNPTCATYVLDPI